jgi:hypothetical protein
MDDSLDTYKILIDAGFSRKKANEMANNLKKSMRKYGYKKNKKKVVNESIKDIEEPMSEYPKK